MLHNKKEAKVKDCSFLLENVGQTVFESGRKRIESSPTRCAACFGSLEILGRLAPRNEKETKVRTCPFLEWTGLFQNEGRD